MPWSCLLGAVLQAASVNARQTAGIHLEYLFIAALLLAQGP
jgi:hypothetical protein